MDFDDVEKKVTQSGSELLELKAAVHQLQARVDRQAVVIQAMKALLLQNGISEDRFLKQVEQAIAEKAKDKACRKCGKPMGAKHNRCIYCGEPRPPEL